MILILFHSYGNNTGGELYDRKFHEYLKSRYDFVYPDKIKILTPELLNPAKHAKESLAEAKRMNPEIAVIELYSGCRNVFAARWLKKNKKHVITVISGLREKFRKNSSFSKIVAKKCEKYLIKKSDIIIAISDYVASYASHYTNKGAKIITAKPGIKVNREVPVSDLKRSMSSRRRVELLTVGACNKVKGTKYIVDAMKYLNNLDARLNIAGPYDRKDPYFIEVNEIISKNKLEGKVIFHGYLGFKDISALYLSSDILIVPSLFEGFGIAIAEALSFGLPVVATNVGAIPELIENGENGILVNAKDSRGLATGILKLIENNALFERISKNNLEKANNLPTWESFDSVLDIQLLPELNRLLKLTNQIGE